MLQNQFQIELSKHYQFFKDKNIFLIFDETTDCTGRSILNILIGECCIENRSNPILIKTIELSKTNSTNINQEIISVLLLLYEGDLVYDKLKLLLSDAAPYAIKTGIMLKTLFPKLKHVTCVCHMLHRLAEKIRDISPKTNYIISEFKRLLHKNKENQLLFTENTKLKLPKFPIITRWGYLDCFCCIFI